LYKVVYILSALNKSSAFEWISESLDRYNFNLHYLLLNPGPSELENYLRGKNIPVSRITCRHKGDWPLAWWKLYRLLKKLNPDIVHCHLQTASILGLSAAQQAGIPKRIYTRHHSSLHHVFHPKGIFWDRFCNKRATHIVAISGVVKKILLEWEKVPEEKIVLIPHGFKLEEFRNVEPERIRAVRLKYGLNENHKVIGVISRLTAWKGVQYIIPAFQSVLKKYPDAVLLLLNAKGDYKKEIEKLLQQLPAENYRVIEFEKDIPAVYKTFDVFVHVPVDEHSEAFGQTYVEALAAGVPSVFTLSGIAPDFIVHEKNALVVPFRNADAIALAMDRILSEPELTERLSEQGWKSIQEKFELNTMIRRLGDLYEK
jgi:glycosyltransferase involved in cell wall biosynthesis